MQGGTREHYGCPREVLILALAQQPASLQLEPQRVLLPQEAASALEAELQREDCRVGQLRIRQTATTAAIAACLHANLNQSEENVRTASQREHLPPKTRRDSSHCDLHEPSPCLPL